MADKPLWLHRVEEIMRTLETSRLPVLDRFTIERLFQVSRRQAIRLMERFGGFQAGRTYLVERDDVVQYLVKLARDGSVDRARRRKERLWRGLQQEQAKARARAVRIPIPPQSGEAKLEGLPEGVTLEHGRLEVTFEEPVELLSKLVLLSQALANDYEQFERRYHDAVTSLPCPALLKAPDKGAS